MLKNILFDMDGTLIECAVENFLKPYYSAILKKFASRPDAKLIADTVLKGAGVMVKNDGGKTNRDAFFAYAKNIIDMTEQEFESEMTEFYNNEYDVVAEAVKPKPLAIEAVNLLRGKGYRLVVTTNPLFPLIALERRLKWGEYDPSVFEFVTSYETSKFSKPSVGYYTEVLDRLGMNPSESMIVGNDRLEDVETGKAAGMSSYWLTDTPIDNCDATPDYRGDSADFLAFVKNLREVKK